MQKAPTARACGPQRLQPGARPQRRKRPPWALRSPGAGLRPGPDAGAAPENRAARVSGALRPAWTTTRSPTDRTSGERAASSDGKDSQLGKFNCAKSLAGEE